MKRSILTIALSFLLVKAGAQEKIIDSVAIYQPVQDNKYEVAEVEEDKK